MYWRLAREYESQSLWSQAVETYRACLTDGGKDSQADQDLQRIIQSYRQGNALLRKHEQEYYMEAKKLLKRKRGFEDWSSKG